MLSDYDPDFYTLLFTCCLYPVCVECDIDTFSHAIAIENLNTTMDCVPELKEVKKVLCRHLQLEQSKFQVSERPV